MEIMEDGNLVDRVRILLQRDMQYYQDMQTVLRETLCVRVSGGKFDFPRHASFAAIKIVTWWEAEFALAFKGPSGLSSVESPRQNGSDEDAADGGDESVPVVVKRILPNDFILLVVETSEHLIEHLHLLIQESLDHADLTVLTATLGAAALIRNCLWCYNQRAKNEISKQSSAKLLKCYKSFNEMTEAVAERLLDLHCRLISLYILNEADSLSWHSDRAFFDRMRCSYVIQMWWLYMQGTKQDLWNTVSPKMAQRVFSGMLNESLSILVARFIHGRPSLARSMQFWSDAFNVLRCAAYLALSACNSGEEMIGCSTKRLSTYARDIHAKCNELLICLLLRGAPLEVLFQTFRNGLDDLTISKPRQGPAPWVYICAPNLLGIPHARSKGYGELSEDQATILELYVLKSQPQPNWSQLVKALSMSDYALGRILLRILMRQCVGQNMPSKACSRKPSQQSKNSDKDKDTCGGFLCAGTSCKKNLLLTPASCLHAIVYVLIGIGGCEPRRVVLPGIKLDPGWSAHLDRQQVWNQDRPPWLNALLAHVQPIMMPIVETLLDAVKTGASTYQAMSLVLACFAELFECLPLGVLRMAFAMDENMPAHCQPIGGSVVLQLLCASLYSVLHERLDQPKTTNPTTDSTPPQVRFDEQNIKDSSNHQSKPSEHNSALAEALCSIDEDDKHTAQISELLSFARDSLSRRLSAAECSHVADTPCVLQTHTDELGFTETGRASLKIVHEYVIRSWKHLLDLLKSGGDDQHLPEGGLRPLALLPPPIEPLTKIMFSIEEAPFDELLHDYEGAYWELMLGVPHGVSKQRVRAQVLSRPELANILRLDRSEREAAHFVKQLCTTGVIIKRK